MTTTQPKDGARTEARRIFQFLSGRLNKLSDDEKCLRDRPVREACVRAINALDEVSALLAHDPTTGSLTADVDVCSICDLDSRRCDHGGTCASSGNGSGRVEPWDMLTFTAPRSAMGIIKAALARANEVLGDRPRGVGTLVELICIDFLATNDFLRKGQRQDTDFLAALERGLGRRVVVLSRDGTDVVYGHANLTRLLGKERTNGA